VTVPDGLDQSHPAPADEVEAPARPSRRALAVLAAVPVLVIVLDQIVKQLSLTHLTGSAPVRLLGGAIYLNLTRNSGAAFSMGGNYTYVFPVIAVLVVSGIIWLSRRLRSIGWAISFGLIIGGAIGNLIDRLFRAPGVFRGQVVDMISLFDPAGRAYPIPAIFNIADSALFCGVVLAIILEFAGRRRDGTRISARFTRDQPPADRAEA
jgi:signal peptidase II